MPAPELRLPEEADMTSQQRGLYYTLLHEMRVLNALHLPATDDYLVSRSIDHRRSRDVIFAARDMAEARCAALKAELAATHPQTEA